MTKKTFKADLSVKGIEALKKQLLQYRDDLPTKCKKLVSMLAEQGVEVAKGNIVTLDAIFTGELLNSIHSVDGGTQGGKAVFYIVADSKHAAFVEFGTGQLGKEAPYPYEMPKGLKWNYNTGKTIFEISPGQYGWFYPGKDGKWYFTQGMPSRPFLYETSIELMTKISSTAREIFK